MTPFAELCPDLCLGLTPPPLSACRGGYLHPTVIEALQPLLQAAESAGFQPAVASGYRDFERQLAIFNAKARGQRPLLDSQGQVLQAERLSEEQRLAAILRWSALPGLSRHHWATDLDIYDAGVCVEGYQVQLTQAECDGAMAGFHQWLTGWLDQQTDWYRPYREDLGGVAPEPWHLSFRPWARQCEGVLNPARLAQVLEASDIELKALILSDLPALVARYTRVAD